MLLHPVEEPRVALRPAAGGVETPKKVPALLALMASHAKDLEHRQLLVRLFPPLREHAPLCSSALNLDQLCPAPDSLRHHLARACRFTWSDGGDHRAVCGAVPTLEWSAGPLQTMPPAVEHPRPQLIALST